MKDYFTTQYVRKLDKEKIENIEIQVSYFITDHNKPSVFVTTETINAKDEFKQDEKEKPSLIGYLYENQVRIAQWVDKPHDENDTNEDWKKCQVFDIDGNEMKNQICKWEPREEPIKSIVCASYKSSGSVDNNVFGACIFSTHLAINFTKEDRTFLKNKLILNFYPLVQGKILIPLKIRKLEGNPTLETDGLLENN